MFNTKELAKFLSDPSRVFNNLSSDGSYIREWNEVKGNDAFLNEGAEIRNHTTKFANQGGQESTLSEIWNSELARHIVPDMIGVNVGFSNVLGVGYGGNIQGFFILRGKDAGFHATWSPSGRGGKDPGFSATIVQGVYNGNPRNATFDSMLGYGADATIGFGVRSLVAGGWVSFREDYSISWYGSNFGIGTGPKLGPEYGGSAGFGTTIPLTK